MSRLEEILRVVYYNGSDSILIDWKKNGGIGEAKEQIKDLILELIGEDEQSIEHDNDGQQHSYISVKNQLRAELRRKVEEL